jgi:hypothetical protein
MLPFNSREYSHRNYRRGRFNGIGQLPFVHTKHSVNSWNLHSIYNNNSRELPVLKLHPGYTAPSPTSHYHDGKYLSFVHTGWAN